MRDNLVEFAQGMRIFVFAIIGVGVATAVLIWGFQLVHDAEKMERNPKLLRRRLLLWGTIYIASSGWGIIQVVRAMSPLRHWLASSSPQALHGY